MVADNPNLKIPNPAGEAKERKLALLLQALYRRGWGDYALHECGQDAQEPDYQALAEKMTG